VPTAPLIARLRHEAPDISAAILVRGLAPARGLAEAMRAGAAVYHWSAAADLAGIVRDVLGARALASADSHVLDALFVDLYPPACVRVLTHCVVQAHSRLNVSDVAANFHISRRSLTRRLRDGGWPPPLEVIEWGRFLRASLMQWRGTSGNISLSRAAGFSSPSAMRQAMRRLLGTSPLTPLYVMTMLRRRLEALAKLEQ
jgi:AraC-like DNA-binding protein